MIMYKMSESLRAANESFLLSSIYQTSASENRQVQPYRYVFNKSVAPMALDHDSEVQVGNAAFNSTMNVELPRKGFSHSGFLKITFALNGTANGVVDCLDSNLHTKFGMLKLINRLRIKTRKEILYTHDFHSLVSWLESVEDEKLRLFYKLVMCQGVEDGKGTVIDATSTTCVVYIPLEVFPMFENKAQALDLNFVEPITLEIDLNAASVVEGDYAIADGKMGAMTSIVLNQTSAILDTDVYNDVLKFYQSVPRSQRISHDYYTNTNKGTSGSSFKLEGMSNVVKLYVMAEDANGVLVDIDNVKLTSGNKTLFDYNGVESRLVGFHGLRKTTYKDAKVVELSFSLEDKENLSGQSFSGALSVRNLIDPRLTITASGAAAGGITAVAKQLSTVQISHSSGSVSLGSSA